MTSIVGYIAIQDLTKIATTYVVPAAFDPGHYQVTHTDTRKIILQNQAQVRSYVTGELADVQIEKEIELLDSANPSELDYRQTVTLKLLSPTKTLKLGLWNVTQLPAGGSILIGTHKPASYTTYFGQDTQNRVKVSDRCITFCISARESHKIGVKVDAITSKIGYIRPVTADLYAFYLRTITVDPNGDYVDTPWNTPADTGHVIQCYNDDGQFGNFGELEYHSPAIGAATGKSEYRDVSRIQIFTGPKSALRDLCAQQMDIPAASLPI
jgi:hypothetical protein